MVLSQTWGWLALWIFLSVFLCISMAGDGAPEIREVLKHGVDNQQTVFGACSQEKYIVAADVPSSVLSNCPVQFSSSFFFFLFHLLIAPFPPLPFSFHSFFLRPPFSSRGHLFLLFWTRLEQFIIFSQRKNAQCICRCTLNCFKTTTTTTKQDKKS